MGWVWWLSAPLAVTMLAAVLTWAAGRPRRPLTSEEAVSSHRRFLADLADASAPAHRARISEPSSGAAPPGYGKSADAMPGNAMPGNAMPGNAMPGNAMPGNAMPGAAEAGDRAGPDTLLG